MNITYLEYDDWGSSRKNKYICLLISLLCYALQHEKINLIYLFIYKVMDFSQYINMGLSELNRPQI